MKKLYLTHISKDFNGLVSKPISTATFILLSITHIEYKAGHLVSVRDVRRAFEAGVAGLLVCDDDDK